MTRHPALLLVLALGLGGLAACGGGDDGGDAGGPAVAASGPPDAQQVRIDGTPELAFEPDRVTARPGTLTITLGIRGGTPHDLAFEDRSLPVIPTTTAGRTASQTYTLTSGTYDFVCTLHPGMDGVLVVS